MTLLKINNDSSDFENTLEILKRDYSQTTNSKAVLSLVLDYERLISENSSLRLVNNRLSDDNSDLLKILNNVKSSIKFLKGL
jgi:hypothetical protein